MWSIHRRSAPPAHRDRTLKEDSHAYAQQPTAPPPRERTQYGPRMLLQVRAHARAFAKFANVLPISMQNKCYSRSICMPVRFSRGHGRDIKGHGMLFYMR